MTITATVKKKEVALRSKTPRTELFVIHNRKKYILKTADSTPQNPAPSLVELENKKVELEGYVVAGTNVFRVTSSKII